MATRTLTGSWPGGVAASGASGVFIDSPAATGTKTSFGQQGDKSVGLVRISPISDGPHLTENWTVLGWSIRLGLVYAITGNPSFVQSIITYTPHARIGDLWGGLAIQSQQQDSGGISVFPSGAQLLGGRATFPPDLSTFDVLWTQDANIAVVSGYDPTAAPLPARAVPALVGKTFMLPAPVPVDPGTQMQMQLVLTPSLYFGPSTGGYNALHCTDATWSLIYDDGRSR